MDDFILEKKIHDTLEKQAGSVCADGLAGQRIRTRVSQRIEEESNMKRYSWKKVAVVAAAICVFGSITAVALGRPAYTSSHSSHDEEIHVFADAEKQMKGLDSGMKAVERFDSTGYEFAYAVPNYSTTHDEEHNVLKSETSISYAYKKEGLANINFRGTRLSPGYTPDADETVTLDDGTVLYYKKTVNKFVPPDYEMTEEDERMVEEGMNLAYGSSEVEIKIGLSVVWNQDGITYSLFTFEDSLSAEEMLAMAREIAES